MAGSLYIGGQQLVAPGPVIDSEVRRRRQRAQQQSRASQPVSVCRRSLLHAHYLTPAVLHRPHRQSGRCCASWCPTTSRSGWWRRTRSRTCWRQRRQSTGPWWATPTPTPTCGRTTPLASCWQPSRCGGRGPVGAAVQLTGSTTCWGGGTQRALLVTTHMHMVACTTTACASSSCSRTQSLVRVACRAAHPTHGRHHVRPPLSCFSSSPPG
jgi:hypothetical protein